MPLLAALAFFALLFCGEAIWFDARSIREKTELERYEQVEHPRRRTGEDRYIDLLA